MLLTSYLFLFYFLCKGGFIQGHLRLSLIAYDNWSTEGKKYKL